MRLRTAIIPLVLLLISVVAFPSGPLLRRVGAADDAHMARVAVLVADLDAHARWCQKRKLFRDRNETYAVLLTFDADHRKARRWLKYKRAKDGTWTRKAGFKPPRNLKAPGREPLARREALGDRFAEATFAWLRAHTKVVKPEQRARLVREMLRAAAHRADVREAHGEVLTAEGIWLLRESLASPRRRKTLTQTAAQELAAVRTPKEARPTAAENATRVAWQAIVQGPRARVLGTVPLAEVRAAHALASAASPVFAAVYGGEAPTIKRLTIMLITSDEQRATLLKNHPASTKAFRSFAATLASGWFPKTSTIYARSRERAKRLEWSARQPLGALLRRRFGVRTKNGWAFEGFGLYVSHLLSGHRRTFYVRRTQYGDTSERDGDLWDKLTEDDADWREHARELLASDRAPNLRLLLGKPVNAMNTEDMLVSYVLAAYILEGRAEQAGPLLKAIGDGQATDSALREGLGLDVEGLGQRLRRWLDETK